MNIDLRSIDPLRDLSQQSIQAIEEESQIINFPIGFPILRENVIPNEVLIILSGEARLIHEQGNQSSTICKLKADDFIGLSSFLRVKGCEYITASTEVMVMSISDKLILKLYIITNLA